MSDGQPTVDEILRRVENFRTEAQEIFATHESAIGPRVFSIRQTRKKLSVLSVRQESLFEESLACAEYGFHRAAILAAWIAFADLLEEKLASDGLSTVHTVRPNWDKSLTIHELREKYGEFQIIEVAHLVGLISKQTKRILEGNLSMRNDCAHNSDYDPDINEALGYISGLLGRVQPLINKAI